MSSAVAAAPSRAAARLPQRQAPAETIQWAQLAGSWDCAAGPRDRSTTAPRNTIAVWTWEIVLGGHAVHDTYVGVARDDGTRFRGSALRTYNPELGAWEVAWVDNGDTPANGSRIKRYRATFDNGEIVMRQIDGDPAWRTVFFDIRADSFEWRNEPSQQTMHCLRRPSGRP